MSCGTEAALKRKTRVACVLKLIAVRSGTSSGLAYDVFWGGGLAYTHGTHTVKGLSRLEDRDGLCLRLSPSHDDIRRIKTSPHFILLP